MRRHFHASVTVPSSLARSMLAMERGGPRPEVVLFVLDAGGGHRAAANALIAAAEQTGSTLAFEVVNLQDVLAPIDITRRLTGAPMEQTYNAMVRRRLTGFLVPMLRAFQWWIARLHGPLTRLVATFLASRRPAAVVSLIPNFNAVIRDAVAASHPAVPFVVLLTDLADFSPHFWIEPGIDRVIVGTDRALDQALAVGLPAGRIDRTSGMVLHPRFYPRGGASTRERLRRELAVGPGTFVVLVLFGAKGSPEMRPLCEALLREAGDWHVVAICGENPELFLGLAEAEAGSGGRLRRLGFTTRVAEYLAACDVVVTKPGPGTLAEAFHQQVPVVVACNRHTIPQERYNARFVEESGLGLVVRRWQEMPRAVAGLAADPQGRARIHRRLAGLPDNRAVYESLAILEREVEGRLATRQAPVDVRMFGRN